MSINEYIEGLDTEELVATIQHIIFLCLHFPGLWRSSDKSG